MNESDKPTNEAVPTHDERALLVDVFGRTDVGLVRDHNEDNFLVADLTAGNRSIRPEVRNHQVGPKGSIFVVCDGMGGAAAGEVASQIAVDTIYDMMQQGDAADSEESLAQKLEKAICEAGRRILTAAKLNRSQRGMGTTVTAAALIGPRLIVGQVGDSRAYILRNRKLVQITKDQSLVQQLIDAKQMTEEEAKTFDKNNIILQALGTSEEVHVDVTSIVLKQGDRLVMCSDGLSGLVDNDVIRDVVHDTEDSMEACKILTDKACEGGGHDNITAIVATFAGDALALPPTDDAPDPELSYSRFAFSRASETTARKLRPGRPPEHREPDTEVTQPISAVSRDVQQPAARRGEEGRRSPARLVAAAVAAASIAVIAAVLAGGEEEEAPEPQTASPTQTVPPPPTPTATSNSAEKVSPPEEPMQAKAPSAALPVDGTAPTADSAAPEMTPEPKPEPEPEPEESDSPTEAAAPQDAETAVAAPAPPLSPTPEEAITKGKNGRSSRSGRKARRTKETQISNADTAQTPPDANEGANETPPPSTSESAAEKSKEQAAETPKADGPKGDAPKADTPKADAPKADTPKADAPKADTPKADAPKAGGPKADGPKGDAPKEDAPQIAENPFGT